MREHALKKGKSLVNDTRKAGYPHVKKYRSLLLTSIQKSKPQSGSETSTEIRRRCKKVL